MSQPDEEMFDDLHEGVHALRTISRTKSSALTEKAVETLHRLETTVPAARDQLRAWKEQLKNRAMKAAQKTDQAAHEHPWIFTLSALGFGLLAGMVIAHSMDEEDGSSEEKPESGLILPTSG